MLESLQESCGVFGVYAPGEDVSRITFFGIYALQHRGQESAGIATGDGSRLRVHTQMGLVNQAFDETILERLTGHLAVGHTRYSTTGSSAAGNAQPLLVNGPWGPLALAHNGNVVNALELRRGLEADGVTFTTSTDSEVIAWLIATAPGRDWPERIRYAMGRLQGAYSLTMATPDTLIACRDPLGVRPLSYGRYKEGWVVASETCALDHLGAELGRDVRPGEAIVIDANGLSVMQAAPSTKQASCIFEHIYFSRPDSRLDGDLVYQQREAMGMQLAVEHPVDADVVTGIPDSATAAGLGYARQSGIPYSDILVKNRYVGRTFIQPDQGLRDRGVALKFNPLPEVVRGKRVILVDDSIVRGTTTPHVINLVRRSAATEVHVRVCAPPIRWPCHFGVDMATRGELVAAKKSVEQIRRDIGADSLGYLSVEGLSKVVDDGRGATTDGAVGPPGKGSRFCKACFTGHYPIPVQLELDKFALETV